MAQDDRNRWVRPEISVGNIITIIGLAIGLIGGWLQLQSVQDDHGRRIVKLEEQSQKARDNELETVRFVAEIRSDIKYLRNALERIERDKEQ